MSFVEEPRVDGATLALWRMDEATQPALVDSGPHGLTAYAGRDARPEFGRFRSARRFSRSLESFVYVPYAPVLDVAGAFSVEAWIQPSEYGLYEVTVIVGRWTRNANQQSWLLGLAGEHRVPLTATRSSLGALSDLIGARPSGTLVFAIQPADASQPRAYFSTGKVALGEWSHVAATYDGQVVRIYLNGRLDAQFASAGGIRPSDAPLFIGNLLDSQWISTVAGSVRLEGGLDEYPFHAFSGLIDEVRLSSLPRVPSRGH